MTKRTCDLCENPLVDTIIYCNESRWLAFPQNWKKIEEIKNSIDLIIVLGTSCKVLAGYEMLFPPDAKIYIVNQGRTEIDELAHVKFNDDCDVVMQALSTTLRLSQPPNYCRTCDPILNPSMNVAINEWPKCICGRRPIRKLAKHLYSTSASILETKLFPSWMVVPLSNKKRSNNSKRKISSPMIVVKEEDERKGKSPFKTEIEDISSSSTTTTTTIMSSTVLEEIELEILPSFNLPVPANNE
uniref:Deacetylase sirtuin-type domain-containing protein n=1 Tax=Panagrolaimus superbus TaxID=310955 RepID=A0A914ZBA0_9BILA